MVATKSFGWMDVGRIQAERLHRREDIKKDLPFGRSYPCNRKPRDSRVVFGYKKIRWQIATVFLFYSNEGLEPAENCKVIGKPELQNAHNKDRDDDQGQGIGAIGFEPAGHLQALTDIGFFDKILKAPALLADAEEDIDQRTDGQAATGDQKVFRIRHTRTGGKGNKAGEQVEAKRAGDGKDQYHF